MSMTDEQAARLRALATASLSTVKGRFDLAMEGDAILALLDERDALRRERDDADRFAAETREKLLATIETRDDAVRFAAKSANERDAAVALLTEAGMYVNPHTADDPRAMALWERIDAMLGGGEG